MPVSTASVVHFSPGGPAQGRVTRSGQSLSLSGAPYRFIGLNVWRAAVSTANCPPNTGYKVGDGTTLADTLAAIRVAVPHVNVVRCWFFQQLALNSAGNTTPSLPYNWASIDKVLTVAAAHGMKVLACLQDTWSWLYTNADLPQLPTSWFSAGGYDTVHYNYEAVPFRQYVTDFMARYAGDPRILALELVNEADVSGGGSCPGTAAATAAAFAADVCGIIKAADPGMLTSFGITGEVCGFAGAGFNTVHAVSSLDLCSFHDYTGTTNAGGTWGGSNGLDDEAARAAVLGKPVYVGELGIHLNAAPCSGDASVRASYLDAKLSAQFGYGTGMAGSTPWGFDLRGVNGSGDDYQYPAVGGAADPGLAVLDTYHL